MCDFTFIIKKNNKNLSYKDNSFYYTTQLF